MASPDFDFDWTIAPTSRETFFADYFEKKPLVIARNDPSYYADLLGIPDIDHVVSTMGLFAPEVMVTRADGNITPEDYAYESGFIDPVRVNQLYADGATVIVSGLHERLPKLARFCRAIEAVMSSRVQTNTYLTPANCKGFKAHYDNHDVIVLQVAGTKIWRMFDTPVELPLNSQAFDPHDVPIGEQTAEYVLHPGDMMYIPRGLSHDAVATDEASLHVATGLMVRTWADVLAEAVNVLAHDDPAFRRALPPGFVNPGFDASPHKATFDALMAQLAATAPFEKLLVGFKEDFLTNRLPRVEGQMAQIAKLDGLSPQSRISARPHLIYDLTLLPDEEAVRLVCNGAEIVLPEFAAPTLTEALKARDIQVADLPGELDTDGKLVLVRRLVREGLLTLH